MDTFSFKVSARTGRLIGRENIANERSAVTELVKNAYDADASYCFVIFKKRHSSVPDELSKLEGETLEKTIRNFSSYYSQQVNKYVLNSDLSNEDMEALELAIGSVVDLFIVDNGTGMDEHTIKNSWLVIGTDQKQTNNTSKRGRVLSGSKGIGRFALDRLGTSSKLHSTTSKSPETISWQVYWEDFEATGKTVDQIEVRVSRQNDGFSKSLVNGDLAQFFPQAFPDGTGVIDFNKSFSTGTAIEIVNLRDPWEASDVQKLKHLLEALMPPKEQKDFNIYVADERHPEHDEWVDNFSPDEFDYKLEAAITSDGNVEISLFRNEFDIPNIPEEFFEFKEMQYSPYRKSDLQAGKVTILKSIGELLKTKDKVRINDFVALGPFNFTLYFSKLQLSRQAKELAQKEFDATRRARWLGVNAGLKIYRDDILVRPFGEFDSGSFDWLSLGRRATNNPAALTRIGGWKMNPQNAAGTISITRERNPSLEDQSNREGISDSVAFSKFRELIVSIISVLEHDRSYLFHFIKKANDQKDKRSQAIQEAREIVSASPKPGNNWGDSESQAFEKLKVGFKFQEDALRERDETIQLLRAMATQGTVMIAFTHELKTVLSDLNKRTSRLKTTILNIADKSKLEAVDPDLSPIRLLEIQKNTDEKVINWINFASTSITPKKRRRRKIVLKTYFAEFEKQWSNFLKDNKIDLMIQIEDSDIELLAHEIDLDSIFFNLVVNSVEEFIDKKTPQRLIKISVEETNEEHVSFKYEDSGPGLSNTFNVADDIFNFGVSTKPNLTGDSDSAAGTGIGMWILHGVVEDAYNGSAKILSKIGEENFKIEINLPSK